MKVDPLINKHKDRFQSKLLDLRKNDWLYDFTIFVGDREIRAHRLVLAASSDYFERMFAHRCQELEEAEVRIQNQDAGAIESIINFCYTFELDLNNDNIQNITLAASMLQIQCVQDLCVQFLKNNIDAGNCLSVLQISERCNFNELACRAIEYCLENFRAVIKEREFLEIDGTTLARIISDDRLNIDDETIVFEAVIKWYEEDTNNRGDDLHCLLKEVRYVLMDPEKLIQLRSSDYVKSSPELIYSAIDFLLLRGRPDIQSQYLGALNVRPRERAKEQRIYSIGGFRDVFNATASGEVYDPDTNNWSLIRPMSQKRFGLGLAILGDWIYAAGGHDGRCYLTSVERYNIEQGTWHKDVADMRYPRTSFGAPCVNGRIYAIGGETNKQALNLVATYDPLSNRWTDCQPMGQRRLGPGVVALDGLIFVMGGSSKDGPEEETIHNSVERYDPVKDKWEYMRPMAIPRKHLGSCVCQGKIYAVGGRNESGELDSAEVYDPYEDSWSMIAPMQKKRSGMGLVGTSSQVYAIGGQRENLDVNDVESYDLLLDTWTWRKPMEHRRLGGGAVVHVTKKQQNKERKLSPGALLAEN